VKHVETLALGRNMVCMHQ